MSYGGATSFGWLNDVDKRSGGANYTEGYPTTATPVEADVVAQWIFDEAAGAIADEVSAISLAAVGAPTYNVTGNATGVFALLAPGITYGSGKYHKKGSAEATMDAGTGDFTVEIWFATTLATNSNCIFTTQEVIVGAAKGYGIYLNGGAGSILCWVRAENGDQVQASISTATTWNDGNLHKLRAAFTRAGNVALYMDGIHQGSAALTDVAGDTLKANNVRMCSNSDDSSQAAATLYTVRVSLNASNNSGGPAGG